MPDNDIRWLAGNALLTLAVDVLSQPAQTLINLLADCGNPASLLRRPLLRSTFALAQKTKNPQASSA